LSLQKRLAAEILGVGVDRVKILPEYTEEIEGVLTKDDIRKLIEEGKIIKLPIRRNSRGRIRIKKEKKRKKSEGRKQGSRKGNKNARANLRLQWINKIRKMRKYLKFLRDNGKIDIKTYRLLYRRAKGGSFKSLSDLKVTLRQMGIKVE
jgi:large subunit ribosomal protein L19e